MGKNASGDSFRMVSGMRITVYYYMASNGERTSVDDAGLVQYSYTLQVPSKCLG